MANIATLSAKLLLDGQGFLGGIDRVKKAASSLASASNFKGIAGGIFDALKSGATGGLAEGLTGVLRNFVGSIPAVGGMLGGIFDGVLKITNAFNQLSDAGKTDLLDTAAAGQKLGVSLKDVMTLQVFAGTSFEKLERALFRLNAELGRATAGGAAARRTFAQFGLDANKLDQLGGVEQMAALLEQYKKLGPGGGRDMLSQLFGNKLAPELVRMFERGPKGLADAAALVEKTGGGIFDTSRLRERELAMRAFELSIRQANMALAEQRAAYHAALVEGFGGTGTPGPMKIFDFSQIEKGAYKALGGVFDYLTNNLAFSTFAAFDAVEKRADKMVEEGHKKAAQEPVRSNVERRRAEQMAQIDELAEKMRNEIAVYGQSGHAADILRLKQQGATAAMLEGLVNLQLEHQWLEKVSGVTVTTGNVFEDAMVRGQLFANALKAGAISAEGFGSAMGKLNEDLDKTAANKAWSVWSETRTPLEKYKTSVEELQGLLGRGLIDQDTFARGLAGAAKKMEGAAGLTAEGSRRAGVMERGSKEAYSALLKARDADRKEDPMKRIADAQKKLQEEARKQTDLQMKLLDAFNKNLGGVVEFN